MTTVSDIAMRDGLPRKLDRKEWVAWVRELVAEGGRVVFRDHAYDRLEKREISNAQIFEVLRRGEAVEDPVYSTKYQNWECLLVADAAGEEIHVKAAIEIERLMGQVVVVITAF